METTFPFVITVSRQLGAGGMYVGRQLAQQLNLFYADRAIIRQAATQLSALEEVLESREEKVCSFWKSFRQSFAFGATDVYIPPEVNIPTSRELFETEAEIIRRIAKESSAVIIGRCGPYVLRKHPNHINVFLHGNMTFRRNRIQDLYHVSEEAAEKMIARSDKDRARYHRTFTGREWMDARRYHISLDASAIGLDKSVALIVKYTESMMA